jgi:hypothetical protein
MAGLAHTLEREVHGVTVVGEFLLGSRDDPELLFPDAHP